MIIPFLQPLQRPPPIFCKQRFSGGHQRFGEEPGLPFGALVLACGRLLPLLFLELLFQFRGLAVLLVEDGFGDAVPEAAALVAELLGFGRDDLGDRPEGVEVDEELWVLWDEVNR